MMPFAVMRKRRGFTPVLVTYTSGTSVTETAPAGATNVVVEVWGGGGGGHRGDSAPTQGFSGGAAGYSRTSMAISGGQTLIYTVGPGGKGQDATASVNGTASTVSSGTATITTMTANGGGRATGILSGFGIAGTGGAATGGTVVNTTGTAGDQTGSNIAAPVGVNANLTGTNGAGGAGSVSNVVDATAGGSGMVAFYYT